MGRTLVISGASGLVGQHLGPLAEAQGYEVRRLSRRDRPGFRVWAPSRAAAGDETAVEQLREAVDGADVIINLAGSSVDDGRLGPDHVADVLRSRLDAGEALARAWRASRARPSVWLQASAVGIYGDCGDEFVTVDRPPGPNLLAPVCEQWEAAGDLGPDGPRRCVCRIGVVMARGGNAWEKIVKPVKFGVAGKLGSGRQFWPWVHAEDLARMLLFLAESELTGAFNLTAPEPTRQIDFTRAVARRLGRPAILHTPAFAIRIALGGVADDLVLASCRARPDRLLEAGFTFNYPTLPSLLDALL